MASSNVTFKELGISAWLTDVLQTLSIHEPTQIQRACIRPILEGQNVIGNAKTGSGKTAAFALPIIQKLSEDPYGPFALVLTPTRELAFQIAEQFRALGTGINLREAVVVGGMDMMAQGLELEKRPHILIGTPGRIVDHLNSGTALKLNRIKFLVLDEADRLLHPTFSADLEAIFEQLPKKRQTLLFSATMTKSIEALIGDATSNLFVHRSSEKYEAADKLEQKFVFVPSSVKEAYLVHLLRNDFKDKSIIIFTSRCRTCALMLALIQNFGIRATALHSFMTQAERVASLAKFKSNVVDILLATDVGSRGLDIPKVQLVINFDVPACATDYIHRVGRTARAGRGGMALSVVCERDVDVILNIEAKMGAKLGKYEVDDDEVAKLEFLNEVNIAKREALMHLEETGFGTKKEINMKKRRMLDVDGETKGDADQDTDAVMEEVEVEDQGERAPKTTDPSAKSTGASAKRRKAEGTAAGASRARGTKAGKGRRA
ncbi:hypothetical protein AMAG_03774 [Allomyces macrogynus ATCC 38327]|uniref:ATP-dependent rRNA helicase RRP3 n=1 Tax=Allomyces macrogynus (strain ATCC 38327) TaxID=578462 RepID=A0A0L0SAK3_ALLM3|nr:hypothetical protein AMAG_03774 [Allomyces macrogynus ATCC 38327]|eukprot:KNE59501.1 hypothetical protein AMAG_03774 [Allomyces macrogynus ATCC 38327]